jgi:UDP-glucuronate 4-epimerase
MKILVTGAAGFIGRNLVEELAKSSCDIIAVDSLNDLLYSKALKLDNFHYLSKLKNVQCYQADSSNLPRLKVFDDFDVIINLAALPGQKLSWENLDLYIENNLLNLNQLIRRYCLNKPCYLLQASTSSVYGTQAVHSNSALQLNPGNPYGVSKLAAEKLIEAYSENFNVRYSILRFFSVYGPYQRPDMGVTKFIDGLLNQTPIDVYGDGFQTRSLTYVKDAVMAIISSIQIQPTNLIIDVSGNRKYSVREIIQSCEQILNKKAILRYCEKPPGDQMHTLGSVKLMETVLNISQYTSLEVGLQEQMKVMQMRSR